MSVDEQFLRALDELGPCDPDDVWAELDRLALLGQVEPPSLDVHQRDCVLFRLTSRLLIGWDRRGRCQRLPRVRIAS